MLTRVGLNPDKMEEKVAASEGEGGPLIHSQTYTSRNTRTKAERMAKKLGDLLL